MLSIEADYTNLLLGLAHCKSSGDIATYSACQRTSQSITLTSTSYPTAMPDAAAPYLLPEPALQTDLPSASGMVPTCDDHSNYETLDDRIGQCHPSPDIEKCTF